MREIEGSPFPTSRLLDGRPRAIFFDATKCIGCRQCVQACKDWNDLPRTTVYELSSTNRLTIEPPVLEGVSRLWGRNSCMHCEFPVCAAVCPVEAITKYQEGPVVIDPQLCIGCEYCIHACPWGVIAKSNVTQKATKCTMCSDRIREEKIPFCVQACPVDALAFGLQEEVAGSAARRAAEVHGHLYGNEEAGGTHLVYLLKESTADHGLRSIARQKYPRHRIPWSLMLKDVFTLRLGVAAKARALYLAVVHPRRLVYRYWPWRGEGPATRHGP